MRYDLVATAMVCWGLAVFLPKLARGSMSAPGVVLGNAIGYLLWLPWVLCHLTPEDKRLDLPQLYAIATGALFVAGNLAFYKLLGEGQVVRMVPLTALYVVIPVVLGAVLLREELSRAQWCGVGLAVVAAYLLSLPGPAATS
jgi:drug/metabolite transporter (DMT)-like permease